MEEVEMNKSAAAVIIGAAVILSACSADSGSPDTGLDTGVETAIDNTVQAAAEQTASAEVESSGSENAGGEADAAIDPGVSVMSHEEFMEAELDSQVVVETYVQDKQSWWEDKASIYAQSEDGAYFLYNAACSEEDFSKLEKGTKLRVSGYKAEWSGEVEITDAAIEILDGSFIAEPLDITELLGTEDIYDHQNEYVAFKNLTIESSGTDEDGNELSYLYNWDGSGAQGDDVYFKASYGGKTYSFTIESYLRDASTEVYKAAESLAIGDTVDLEGFLYWYEGANPHITEIIVK